MIGPSFFYSFIKYDKIIFEKDFTWVVRSHEIWNF